MTGLRELVIDVVISARTAPQVERAERVLSEYVELSGDQRLLIYGAGLARMRDALRLIEMGLGDETDPARRRLA